MDLTHKGWTLRLHCFVQQILQADGVLHVARLAVSAGYRGEVRRFCAGRHWVSVACCEQTGYSDAGQAAKIKNQLWLAWAC